jgi:hypothetical protein
MAQCAVNVIDAGGRGASDNMSIWLAVWSKYTAYGVFPQGSKAGLVSHDFGETDLHAENGDKYRGYRRFFRWETAICPVDWRYIVRIANIGVPKDKLVSAQLLDLMDRAIKLLPKLPEGAKPAFYMNRTARYYCDTQAMDEARGDDRLPIITRPYKDGEWQDEFRDIPIRIIDVLKVDESRVL